jgi:hypothetical protein
MFYIVVLIALMIWKRLVGDAASDLLKRWNSYKIVVSAEGPDDMVEAKSDGVYSQG